MTEYQHIPTSGVLPDDLVPADQISFGYAFTYERDVDPLGEPRPKIAGQVILELKDSAGNLKATFDLRETYQILMLSMAPGLLLFSWDWVIGQEKFSATDAAGAPITTEGQFSRGVDPAQGYGNSDRTAYVQSTFYSFIFNIDVDEGDVLKIKKHTMSAGSVIKQASLLVATRPASTKSPAIVDERQGQQLHVSTKAQGSSKGTHLVRSRRLSSPQVLAQTEWTQGDDGLIFSKPLSGAQMTQTEGNSLYVLGTSEGLLLLFRSQDQGKTWKQIMSEPTKIKILASYLASGGRYIVYGLDAAQKPSYAILKHGQDKWTISESGLCTLPQPAATPPTTGPAPAAPTLPTTRVSALEEGEGGMFRLLATDKEGALLVFLSRDGKAWQQAPTTQSAQST